MQIVHICLACFYVEGLGYQENLLPQCHARMGHNVCVLTSDYAFDSKRHTVKKEVDQYVNQYGVEVKVLKRTGGRFSYGRYQNVYKELEKLEPAIIFVHGGQFLSLWDVLKYCKKHPSCKLFVDQHGDYYNTPLNTLKKKVLYQALYGAAMRACVPYVEKFWGVTPWRCQYLNEVYKIPKEKIGLLVMGGDDKFIRLEQRDTIRRKLCVKHNLSNEDFMIVTGGKIDQAKNVHLLLQAIRQTNKRDVKLLLFGQPNDAMEKTINRLCDHPSIRNLDWIPSEKVYDYFLASDLAVFPGTHSVLWEQACACGLPGLFKYWEGMLHVDVGGNAEFLYKDDADEIAEKILDLYNNREKYASMKRVAQERGVKTFSYREIAKKAIGIASVKA